MNDHPRARTSTRAPRPTTTTQSDKRKTTPALAFHHPGTREHPRAVSFFTAPVEIVTGSTRRVAGSERRTWHHHSRFLSLEFAGFGTTLSDQAVSTQPRQAPTQAHGRAGRDMAGAVASHALRMQLTPLPTYHDYTAQVTRHKLVNKIHVTRYKTGPGLDTYR